MTNPELIFDGKYNVRYRDKRVPIKTSTTVRNRQLLNEISWRYEHVARQCGHKRARAIVGLDNSVIHHYQKGKSNAISLKSILRYCDATSTWPADIPGLPPDIVEFLTKLLLELGWQPCPKKSYIFRSLFPTDDSLASRALHIRHSLELESLNDWLKLDYDVRDSRIKAAEHHRSNMLEALMAKQTELALEFHVALHRSLIDPKWHPLLGECLEISIRTYNVRIEEQRHEEFCRTFDESHRLLIRQYQTWDHPSNLEEARAFLSLRHTRCSQLLRGLSG